jgi:hypothetical protein
MSYVNEGGNGVFSALQVCGLSEKLTPGSRPKVRRIFMSCVVGKYEGECLTRTAAFG